MTAPKQLAADLAVEQLVAEYIAAKSAEAAAIERRVAIGDAIADILGRPDEGSRSHNVCGARVTVTQPINRTVSWERMDLICCQLLARNPELHLPIKTVRELDITGCRWLAEHDPDTYRELSGAITAKPGRVQVKVEVRR